MHQQIRHEWYFIFISTNGQVKFQSTTWSNLVPNLEANMQLMVELIVETYSFYLHMLEN